MRLEAVSDSGPFIHLWQIGQLQLLAMFNRLLTTEQVIAEITASGRLREEDLAVLSNLQICSVTQDEIEDTRKQLFGFELHAGELSALRLAQKEEVELFLTDDLEARRAAKFRLRAPWQCWDFGLGLSQRHIVVLSKRMHFLPCYTKVACS